MLNILVSAVTLLIILRQKSQILRLWSRQDFMKPSGFNATDRLSGGSKSTDWLLTWKGGMQQALCFQQEYVELGPQGTTSQVWNFQWDFSAFWAWLFICETWKSNSFLISLNCGHWTRYLRITMKIQVYAKGKTRFTEFLLLLLLLGGYTARNDRARTGPQISYSQSSPPPSPNTLHQLGPSFCNQDKNVPTACKNSICHLNILYET